MINTLMGIFGWFKTNIYATRPQDPDVYYHPRRYDQTKGEVVRLLREVIHGLPGWKFVEYRENQGLLHVTHSGWFPGFVQDIHLYIIHGLDGFSTLEIISRSRTNGGDFGQNKRNIKSLLNRMDTKIVSSR